MQLLVLVNIENFFLFDEDIVFRVRCIASVSAVNIELHFGSGADYVRFPVVAAASTPISLMQPSVYMCLHPLYYFSTTSLNLFW